MIFLSNEEEDAAESQTIEVPSLTTQGAQYASVPLSNWMLHLLLVDTSYALIVQLK
jgi:hypothetical protein